MNKKVFFLPLINSFLLFGNQPLFSHKALSVQNSTINENRNEMKTLQKDAKNVWLL